MTSQCRDHYDIIVNLLINKLRNFYINSYQSAFVYLIVIYKAKFLQEFSIFSLFIPIFFSRFSPCPKIPEPLEKFTFATLARLKIGSKKEKKQPDAKKKLTDYMNF